MNSNPIPQLVGCSAVGFKKSRFFGRCQKFCPRLFDALNSSRNFDAMNVQRDGR